MEDQVLASFRAKDGTGLWQAYPWGVAVDGRKYHFTKTSCIVCGGLPGHDETHVRQVEEDDGLGFWAGVAVYQETGSLVDAGLAAWALGGTSIQTEVDTHQVPGNVQLSINNLQLGRRRGVSLRYREDGRFVQLDAIQQFAAATLAAIRAYRETGRRN